MTLYDSDVLYRLVASISCDFSRVASEHLEKREPPLESGSYYVIRTAYYRLMSLRSSPAPLTSEEPWKRRVISPALSV